MTKLIVQNKKMKKSSATKAVVYNFGIPALRSKSGKLICVGAGICANENDCYAQQGAYIWSNVANAYEYRYEQTLKANFPEQISRELTPKVKTAKRQRKKLYQRIHDSGDFYSLAYWLKWDAIIRAFPSVTFYAYTKNVPMFQRLTREGKLPTNFIVIYSLGGKYDFLINRETERHSRVFETVNDLRRAGYINASSDDLKAISSNVKVGLVYHGVKKYSNTAWAKACA